MWSGMCLLAPNDSTDYCFGVGVNFSCTRCHFNKYPWQSQSQFLNHPNTNTLEQHCLSLFWIWCTESQFFLKILWLDLTKMNHIQVKENPGLESRRTLYRHWNVGVFRSYHKFALFGGGTVLETTLLISVIHLPWSHCGVQEVSFQRFIVQTHPPTWAVKKTNLQ